VVQIEKLYHTSVIGAIGKKAIFSMKNFFFITILLLYYFNLQVSDAPKKACVFVDKIKGFIKLVHMCETGRRRRGRPHQHQKPSRYSHVRLSQKLVIQLKMM